MVLIHSRPGDANRHTAKTGIISPDLLEKPAVLDGCFYFSPDLAWGMRLFFLWRSTRQ